MALQCGIVGLPNVGKSTLFNCLSNAKAQAANFPFCTIEPNVGVITVPDERLTKLAELVHPGRIVPTTVEIVDIAGLVKGASKGEGLGNKFLANIRETDAILHVLRCFDDENVTHVDGSVDPVRDKEIIDTDLQLKDLETIESRQQFLTIKCRLLSRPLFKGFWVTQIHTLIHHSLKNHRIGLGLHACGIHSRRNARQTQMFRTPYHVFSTEIRIGWEGFHMRGHRRL